MSTYKLVDADQLDSNLTTVADAIRAKTGSTETMTFPEGFASAISAIETGSGVGIAEVTTAEEMTALLVEENIGKTYKYVGTTTTDYVSGDIYVVEEVG